MLSISSGYGTGYLTDAVAGGREGYYVAATEVSGEPAGVWYGRGAEFLGLTGEVDPVLLEAVYSRLLDPRDPASHSRATWGEAQSLARGHQNYRTPAEIYGELREREPHAGPERRAELLAEAERAARQAVSFLDATFGVPKSVTLVGVAFERMGNEARAGGDDTAADRWMARHELVEAAVMAGARAGLDHLQDKAGYGRVGRHGGGGATRWTDAHSWVVAQFLQHDSRGHDPHLHVHNAILNRQLCADGVWRALDSRAIWAHRPAAGAIAERVMEAHLAQSLGLRVETRPDGKAREVVGVDQAVMDLFSSRTREIGPRFEELAAGFAERFGRDPNAYERNRMAQQATLETRRAKSYGGESDLARLDRWEAESRTAIGGGLAALAGAVLAAGVEERGSVTWSPADVSERALARLEGVRQSWLTPDLVRAVSDELPGGLGIGPERVPELLEALTERTLLGALPVDPEEDVRGLPGDLTLADGRSVYRPPAGPRYTTEGTVAAERLLRAAAVERGAVALTAEQGDRVVQRFAESGFELGADQAAAVRGVLTSGAKCEVLSSAPGTGKSFVVGAIGEAWRESGRSVFGLATTQVATDVLAGEGLTGLNITRWCNTQQRLEDGRGLPGDEGFRLELGSLVVVDEASMTSTGDLVAVQQRCESAGAKLLLVGDPKQLAPVGPGGALSDVAEHGLRYELTSVRRFSAEWERSASLGLREGSHAAVDEYVKHGRVINGGTVDQAESKASRAWLADTLSGRESLLLVATNEAAARVSAALREQLVALDRVEAAGVPLGLQGTVAGVGDMVQARRNGWELVGFEGNARAPINRQSYQVTGIRGDGGLTVAARQVGLDGERELGAALELPGWYVRRDVALGYASTVHAAEGHTVDTGHAVLGPGMDASAALVALTRGRDGNTAWAVTQRTASDALPGEAQQVQPRTARAVLTDMLDQAREARSASAQREQAAIDAVSTLHHADKLIDGVGQVLGGRTSQVLDELHAAGGLDDWNRERLAGDEAMSSLDALLRRAELAGHDPTEVLASAVRSQELDSARSAAMVLHSRIRESLDGQLTPVVGAYADLIPRDVPDDWREWLTNRAAAADDRRLVLGAEVAKRGPQWAVESLGPVPADPMARVGWELAVGHAAAYRELAGHDSESDALGPAPPAGLPEKHALWHTAHAALGLPDAGVDERGKSDGQLRVGVAAWEREQLWAPRWVGDEFAMCNRAAEAARVDAAVWSARARVEAGTADGERLAAEAAETRQVAVELAARAAELDAADTVRARWYTATASTRDTAERYRAELGSRGVDLSAPEDRTTTAEWLEAHRRDLALNEPGRPVRDVGELADEPTERVRAEVDALTVGHLPFAVETDVPDIRDVATVDVAEYEDVADRGRVPVAADVAAATQRAHDATLELDARQQLDAREDEDRRAMELADWEREQHADDVRVTAWQHEAERVWEH